MDKIESLNIYKLEPSTKVTDKIEVEIGDSKQPDFKPQVKIMRWNNEVQLLAVILYNTYIWQ